MGAIQNYIDKLSKITPAVQSQAMLKIIIKNRTTFIDLNTNQLMNGIDSEGDSLMAYRSKAYAALKLHLNPKGVTDLYLTGAFQHGFFIRATAFPVTIWSSDEKTQMLIEKYGKDIFGLTEQSAKTFREFCQAEINQYYRNALKR